MNGGGTEQVGGFAHVFTLFSRALIMYFFVLIATRILGKREIGQMSPFDFVVGIMIGELAVLSIENHRSPLWHPMVPLATIVVLHILIAFLCLKSAYARILFSGVPTVVIQDGKIVEKNLRRLRVNINDLLASLREKGAYNIADVECAIMEDTGKLSVMMKSQKRPVTPADLGLSTPYEGLPSQVIIDGFIQLDALRAARLDEAWVKEELKKRNVEDVRDVLLAELDTEGNLHVYMKDPVRQQRAIDRKKEEAQRKKVRNDEID